MSNLIKNNSDFLFLYEANQCNPNGDPDQENRPRMDADTNTNLVTDTRVKRYIRDFIKNQDWGENNRIFVDMEGATKVSVETRLKNVTAKLFDDKENAQLIEILKAKSEAAAKSETSPTLIALWEDLKKLGNTDEIFKAMMGKKGKDDKKDSKPPKDYKKLNTFLLERIIHEHFIDIRLFGGAFAVAGFTRSYTGAVQLSWGYSLNEVKLMESSSITSIMSDDSSTFGKDYRVYHSLLAFNGTVNRFAARDTGLSEADMDLFRKSLWTAIPAYQSRSKVNQYPVLYVELVYKDGFYNGNFGDLRRYVQLKPNDGKKEQHIRSAADYTLDTTALEALIEKHLDTSPDKSDVNKCILEVKRKP